MYTKFGNERNIALRGEWCIIKCMNICPYGTTSEVAEIEMWLYWDIEGSKVLEQSKFSVILNEKEIKLEERIALPKSVRVSVLPDSLRKQREHPDIRMARRARTIANLARVISERSVRPGIRRTLWAQSRRLEHLARTRLAEFERGDEK